MNIDTEINKETFKKPFTWAIIIPLVLLLGASLATAKMYTAKSKAVKYEGIYLKVAGMADRIDAIKKDAGIEGAVDTQLEDFMQVNSGRACAKAANIHESRMSQETSYAPKKLKDGRFKYKEIFKLKSVHMLQVAKFVEHAELNYTALICKQISVRPVENTKTKDLWDVTVELEFTSEYGQD
ncbi:MAG: hypothetical protein K9M57_03490 [Phycisphaerae bacterium]|nr:hypothetical protein [Phycisphaerae bacterium]